MTERPEERPEARLVDAIEDTIPLHDVLPIARAMAEVVKELRVFMDEGPSEGDPLGDALQALDSLGDEG